MDEKFLTKEQAKTILSKVTNKEEGVKELLKRGYTLEGLTLPTDISNTQKDIKSQERYNPIFAADTSKSILEPSEMAKGVGNLPSSVLNVGKGLVGGLGGPAKISAEAQGLVKDAGGIMNAIRFAAPEIATNLVKLPVEIVVDLAKQYGGAELLKGDFMGAIDQIHRKLINDPFGAFLDLQLAKGTVTGVKAMAENGITGVAPAVRESVNKPFENIKGAVSSVKEKVLPSKIEPNDLQLIAEKITPKPTTKEAQLATEEGRLYKEKPATWFTSSTGDKVALTEQQAQSARTITKLIPEASKMDEPTLYAAADEQVSTIATKLKPELEKTPLKDETIQKILDDTEKLKETQMSEAKATDEPNISKWQANFEKFINKSKLDNLNDLWETAKSYDNSIKENVKKATEISPEDLQTQKDIWLQNRRILKNAINDLKNGLGEKSRTAFSDMSDLYEAMNGIISKAEINTTVSPAKITKHLIKGAEVIGKAVGFGGAINLVK